MSAYLPQAARLRTLLSLFDLIGMAVAVWLAHQVRFQPVVRGDKWDSLLAYPGFLVLALFTGLSLGAAAELYEPELMHRRREVVVRVLVAVTVWAMTLVFLSYLVPAWALGRGLLLLTTLFWTASLITTRWSLTWWLRRRSRFCALVVGDRDTAARFCRELQARPSTPWAPVDGSAIPHDEIPRAIELHGASMVVLAGDGKDTVVMGRDLARLHFSGVPVVAASEVWAWLEERLPIEALSPSLFLHQPGFGAVHWTLFNRITRIADIFLASLLLLLSSPILLLAALAILLTDGPPMLYRQVRVGQFGRNFTMLKLRTMVRDAEAKGPTFTSAKDHRILAVGGVLRRFRIDELPQLWNVLKGEMSLVGPRPERPEFVKELTREIPYYAFRTAVPPGITGWAQVNVPYAADLSAHRRKLEYDLYFIRERSTRLYLLTLLRTVSAMLVGVRD